jgi:anti-anti-sigma factor
MKMETVDVGPKLVKILLAGRLDTPGVDSIETRFIATLVPNANNAIVDLSQVDFISSMGIRMLLSAARSLKMRRAALSVFGVQDPVNQILEQVALNQMIPVCGTEAEALAAVSPSVG